MFLMVSFTVASLRSSSALCRSTFEFKKWINPPCVVFILRYTGTPSSEKVSSELSHLFTLSWEQLITYGIPQGSTLGPLLFLLYINDITNSFEKLSFRLFADDTNIFFSSSDPKELERTVNAELIKVKNWCNVNKLFINFTKANFMIVKSVRKRSEHTHRYSTTR